MAVINGIKRRGVPVCPDLLRDDGWAEAIGRFRLSAREADVAALILNGCTANSIAQRLLIRPDTVRTYAKRIYQKTGVRTRLDLARLLIITAIGGVS